MLSGPDEEDATGGDGGSGADLRRPADRDRRAGRRHATVLLIGRVMHADRGSICLVHDISTVGLKARFTTLPALGETLEIKVRGMPLLRATVRWVDGFHAGVDFDEPHVIDPVFATRDAAGMIARSPRFVVSAPVRLNVQGYWYAARLVDISTGGAKLEVAPSLCEYFSQGQAAQLVVDPGGLAIFAAICWRRGNRFGLRFVAPLSLVTLSRVLESNPDCQVPIPPPRGLATTTGD